MCMRGVQTCIHGFETRGDPGGGDNFEQEEMGEPPHGQISVGGEGGRLWFWIYSHLAPLLCEPNLISSFAIS